MREREKKCGSEIRYVSERVNMRSVQRESELERSADMADNRQWTRRKSEHRCSHAADKHLIYKITKFISPVCCNRRSRRGC